MEDINKNLNEDYLKKELETLKNTNRKINTVLEQSKKDLETKKNFVKNIKDTNLAVQFDKILEKQEQQLDTLSNKFSKIKAWEDIAWEDVLAAEKNMTIEEAIEQLTKKANMHNNPNMKKFYINIVHNLSESLTLNIFKAENSNIKNPEKILTQYKENYNIVYRKFVCNLLQDNKNKYLPVNNLLDYTMISCGISMDDAKLFLYVFFRKFKNKNTIQDNHILIDYIIKNIYRLFTDKMNKVQELSKYHIEFKNNILEVINSYKKLEKK